MSEKLFQNKSNGFGVKYFIDDQPADRITIDTVFEELPAILSETLEKRSVLLEGEPGAGKTEILDSLFENSRSNKFDCFFVSVHINGGKSSGLDNLSETFSEFITSKRPLKPALVLLDNCDYLGYKGHRSTKFAETYSLGFRNFFERIDRDHKNLQFVGTSHTEEWRQAHWSWKQDSLVLINAQEVLDRFNQKISFLGQVCFSGMVGILSGRGLNSQDAKKITEQLDKLNRLDHWHGKLIDVDQALTDLPAALAELARGKDKRLGRVN